MIQVEKTSMLLFYLYHTFHGGIKEELFIFKHSCKMTHKHLKKRRGEVEPPQLSAYNFGLKLIHSSHWLLVAPQAVVHVCLMCGRELKLLKQFERGTVEEMSALW